MKKIKMTARYKHTRYTKVKRVIDIVLSGTALFFLSPVLLGISAVIKLDSKGPVIFKQTRVGIHKSHFEIYKFRTMYADTPKDMPTHLLKNPDAMVTRAGAFLRRYSLDELPQLWNILRGNMSIVGPRPALWNQYDLIKEREKYGANDVLPGLTGWAQINGRDELEIPVKAALDGEYVRRYGLLMDIRCIIGTVAAVAGHVGVVEGGTGQMKRTAAAAETARSGQIQQSGKVKNIRHASGAAYRRQMKHGRHTTESENMGQMKYGVHTTESENSGQMKHGGCTSGSEYNGKAGAGQGSADCEIPAAALDIYRQQKDRLVQDKKKILITGAGSYIGSAVRGWLSAFGGHYEITELNMHGDGWKQHDFSIYDTVLHVAGIAHADTGKVSNEKKQLYYEVNRDLAVAAAAKAKASGVRQFIYLSSIIIYGESVPVQCGHRRISALTRPQPANFYGNSKWQGDRGVRALESGSFKVCVLRLPMVYGRGSKGNYRMLSKIAGLAPVFPLVKNERSVLHIDNLCEFVRLMIENEESGVFFPQNERYADTSTLVQQIAHAKGRTVWISKALAPFVYLASAMPGRIGTLAGKAFGSFSYDLSLSEYPKGDYRVHDLAESIRLTES